jgi:hypothetical protein
MEWKNTLEINNVDENQLISGRDLRIRLWVGIGVEDTGAAISFILHALYSQERSWETETRGMGKIKRMQLN